MMRAWWLRRRMNTLARKIKDHIVREPSNFTGRESLWMKRENARDELYHLLRQPSRTTRLWVNMFGNQPRMTVGMTFVMIYLHHAS